MELTSITVDLKTQQGTVELAGQFLGRDVRLRIIGEVIEQEGELPAAPKAITKPTPPAVRPAVKAPAKPKPASEETWQQSAIAALRQHQPCTKSELLDHCLMRRLGHTAKQDKAVRTAAYQALWSALASLGKHKQVVKIEENGLDKLRLAPEVQG